MLALLVFSVALLIAVLVSDLARRSVLSTAVLFLAVGILADALGWLHIAPGAWQTRGLVELALVTTLFVDALRIGGGEGAHAWRLSGRALVVGLPLTLLVTALFARVITRLSWSESLLVGAALSPTDPVFAAALIGSEHVPRRLRHLLNVESGVNDGLALPIVLVLLRTAGGAATVFGALAQVALGIAIGAIVPVLAVWLYRRPILGAAPTYKPLFAVAILLLVWTLCWRFSGNEFLGAFTAGAVLAAVSPNARAHFEPAGEHVAELFKLAALLVFGASVSFDVLSRIGWRAYVFAAAALLVARPLAIVVALFRSDLSRPEALTAAWFGPKGFASVLFGLLVLDSQLPAREELFHLIGVVTAGSVLVHSSTDYLVVRWFERTEPAASGAS